jgi:hypothetical protein
LQRKCRFVPFARIKKARQIRPANIGAIRKRNTVFVSMRGKMEDRATLVIKFGNPAQ